MDFFKGRKGRGFWQINTASHIDWPEQSREIEVMDNRDGTLSLFGTLLDSDAPAAAPAPAPPPRSPTPQLASLARTLAFNDPQREGLEGAAATRRRPAAARTATSSSGPGPPLATGAVTRL